MKNIKSYIKKIASTKAWYYIENFLIIFLLFYCVKCLLDYNELLYQIWKNQVAVKAIIAFTGIIFIIRKVKLFNWQSIVVTIVMGVVAFVRLRGVADSPDIFAVVKLQLIAEWLSLLIILDMYLYKNVNNLFRNMNFLVLIYILFTFGAIVRRHDQLGPIILVFPMFLFALVEFDVQTKEWFFRRFIDGWMIAFLYVCIRSFIENPYHGGQYYGYFQMPGPFSSFIICCFAVAIVALSYCLKKYSIKHFLSFACIAWIISILSLLWIIGTRTSLIGLFFSLSFVFIFVRKDSSSKLIICRSIVVFLSLCSIILLLFLLPDLCSEIPAAWINDNLNSHLSFIAKSLRKFQLMRFTSVDLSTKQKIYQYLDIFTSRRISIIKEYSNYFNFEGNGPLGLEITWLDNYYAYSAHNTYVQFLVEYGYISFFELLVVLLLSIIKSTKYYLSSNRNPLLILPAIWFFAMFGIWFGEANMFFYPITFFGFMFVVFSFCETKTEFP